MAENQFVASCKYVTANGKRIKNKGNPDIYNKAKSLCFVIKMTYLQEHNLKIPKVVHEDKAVFLTWHAANDRDYKNLAIVDTDLEWRDPAAPKEWENLVLVIFWKKTQKLYKFLIFNAYKSLPTEYRAYLLLHVAVKAG